MKYLYIMLCLVMMASCHNPKEQSEPEPSYSNAFPLKIGNYWIYRTTMYYKNGWVQEATDVDSTWIDKDTILNGKVYFIKKSTFYAPLFLRESSGIIFQRFLDEEWPIFSRYNYSDTIMKSYPYSRIMTDLNDKVAVPAGNFETISCKTLMEMEAGGEDMHDFPLHSPGYHMHEQSYYANYVGHIKRVSFYVGNRMEENLVRYKVR